MDIRIRIANLPGTAPAAAPAAADPAPAIAPAPTTPAPALQSSLVAAIGRLQIRLSTAPPRPTAGAAGRLIAINPQLPAPMPRPVLILGSIPLAKSKSKQRSAPADEQVIPLVLPEFIEPEEVRGRVRLHAQEFEANPAAEDPADGAAAPVPPPVLPAPPPAAETTPPMVTPAAATTTADAADGAAPQVEAAPPAPKILVRPGPDLAPAKAPDGAQAPEESPAERIARIQREDEEMRNDERKVLRFANDAGKLSSMAEVVLFQNAKPLTINQISRALPGKVNPKQLRQALRLCADRFDRGEHPIELVEIAGGWQLVVRSGFQELIETFAGVGKKRTITGSIMETLAIIAYRQGTTKVEIETLRGINDCSPHLRQLIEMGLVASGRRTDLPGSPMGYWTTPLFMRAVGIRSLDELGQMGEFTPTEVAGLVEIEVPPEGEEPSGSADDPEAAPADNEIAAASAPAADDDNTEPAIDPDAIDAAMTAADHSAAEAEPETPGADLFGEAVVIPVDPAETDIALTRSSSHPPEPPPNPPPPSGKSKRTRKRNPDGL